MKKIFYTLFVWAVFAMGIFGAEKKGPVVYLKFDEGTGNVAKDSSGNALDAKLENITWEKIGLHDHAVRFNGKNSAISLPKHPKLELTKSMTLSVWFKMEKSKYGMCLFAYGNYNLAWQAFVFRSYLMVTSKKMGSAVCYTPISTGTGKMNPYHNAVYTVGPDPANPGKNIMRFYLNGKLLSRKGVSDFPVSGTIPTHERISITLGKFVSHEAQWFNGIMDEVKIYDRALSKEEVFKEYKKTLEAPANVKVKKITLKKIQFPALKQKKIAVFIPPAPQQCAPVMSYDWFKKQGEKLGVQVTFLTEKQLCDKNFLSKKNFDTLILAATAFPFQAEYTIPNFIAQGGNLITSRILPGVYNRDAEGKMRRWGNALFKNHYRGWYSPFLLRQVPAENGSRRCNSALALDPQVAKITGDLLPATFGPFPRLSYRPLDQWVLISGYDCDTGDDFNNYPLAGDVKVDLYKEYNGIGSDFAAYRYYNSKFFGSTLINLGNVGSALLRGKDGEKVFHAILRLLESPLPGELKKEDHKNIVALHKKWSDLGFIYLDAVASLRDAAYFAYTSHNREWKNFIEKLNGVEKSYGKLAKEIKEQRTLLLSEKRKEGAEATAKLLPKINAAMQKFADLKKSAGSFCASAKVPVKPVVKHKYKILPSIAAFTVPINLYRLRGNFFDSVRRIGSNIYSSNPFPEWYLEDPVIREKMKGILRDHKFVFAASARRVSGGGRFNPANGTVKETEEKPYPEESLRQALKTIFENWKWKEKEEFRIGTGDETGLGLSFWGEAANKKLREHLKKYYKNDVKKMNAHCGTSYKSFNEVKVPLRQPVTPAQHAIWEHFRKCREARLEYIYSKFYSLVKEFKPNLDVFGLPSTGGSLLPLYGINYYNLTKYQDVSGIDGTTCGIDKEWIFLDLTTKRYLTSEWGALYRRNPVQYVHGQAWQELSGGALGMEQFICSFGNHNCNYIDFLDHPTIYGAFSASLLKDARKIDHILLDGDRAVPEVGILFSQTSKIHDQNWGWAGGSTFSSHMHSVSVYYGLFLQYGRSARVYAEEALLENKMPFVKTLIVPQAEYLSAEVQKKLLEYVKKGGKLIVEGRMGRFDQFGKKSDLFFRESNVIPFFTDSTEVKMDNTLLKIQKQDSIYSPAGKGKILAAYSDGKPAILTANVGKGSVTYIGFGVGLHRYGCFTPVTDRVLRSLSLSPRFIVSDKDIVLREWQYNGDTYLILNSKGGQENEDWGAKEITVSVRGNVGIVDYLFGKKVKSSFRNNYTVFKTLIANGGRIFRIEGRIAPPEKAGKDHILKLEGSSESTDNYKNITLPFQDRIHADSPVKAQGYIFSASLLGSGDKPDVGNAFLTIRKGDEIQKKRMEKGKTVYYRFRDDILQVKCINNFFMYPFYIVLEIRKVKALPPARGARVIKNKKGLVTFSNDLISLVFDSTKGAKLLSFMPEAEKEELIYPGERAWMVSNNIPGPFAGVEFKVDLSNTPSGAKADFRMAVPVQNRELKQSVKLLPHAAAFYMNTECINAGKGKLAYDLRFHPGLQLGGAADNHDAFFISRKDGGVEQSFFRGQDTGKMWYECGSWGAVVDTKEKTAYICSAKTEQIKRLYTWEATTFYTLEFFSPYGDVEAGKSRKMDMLIQYMHGLSGIHCVNELNAAYLILPGAVDQNKAINWVLELATSNHLITAYSFTASLWKDNRKMMDFQQKKGSFAFDLPDRIHLKPLGKLSTLADGKYEVRVKITSANGNLVFRRPLVLAGERAGKLMQTCSALEKRLEAKSSSLASEKRFALVVKLGEMRNALARYELSLAEKIAAELQNDLK